MEAVIAAPAARDLDERGNSGLAGNAPDGRRIRVVVASDDPDFVIPSSGATEMRAGYDSTANAISIAITDATSADHSDEVHHRAIVALTGGRPVEVQLLYPDLGIAEPIAAVAQRYGLDREALTAAAQSALSAPNRVVSLEVAGGRAA